MKPDLVLIAHEVKELARQVTDKAAIAYFINKVHGTNYHASDIEKIQLGIKPTASMPRNLAGVRVVVGEPIAWTPPISTHKDGKDPLVKALAQYHAKRTSGDLRAHWEALAA